VDCSQFAGAAPSGAAPIFISVGRFVDKKGPQLTLAAFADVHRAEPAARLRMIGDGPLLDECRTLAVRLGVNRAVTFLGQQPPSIVQLEMRGARCFVQHSVEAATGDCEGTPVGILEAGASGLPVVSTRHGGIPDVIVEGKPGFWSKSGMSAEWRRTCWNSPGRPRSPHGWASGASVRIATHFSKGGSLARLWSTIDRAMRDAVPTSRAT
jgi:glycosyltransferase involved in cell wall biosynthesis